MDTPEASIGFTVLLFIVVLHGLFVLTETAIVESRKAKLEKLAEGGDKSAAVALRLIDNASRALAAVQIGITLSGVLVGALAGALVAPVIAGRLAFLPGFSGYADFAALVLGVAACLYLTLVLGKFVPKRIAENNPEPILVCFADLLAGLEKCSAPLVAFLFGSTRWMLLFVGINPNKTTAVTEDEVRTLIEQGTEEGTFEKTEQDMVDRIFRLSDQNANALMTPRTQMLWLDLEDPLAHNLEIIRKSAETIFPVGRDNLDDFAGVLYAKDLLDLTLEKRGIDQADFERCIRTPMFIPKSMHSFKILENFQTSGTHEAIVLDEYGGVIGFITIRDIITEVVGDISFSAEPESSQITPRDDHSWLVDGLLPIDEFKEYFNLDALPEEDRNHYQTMGGFITSYLGYIPVAAERFTWNDFVFEIVDMDRVRVDKILVTKRETRKAQEDIAS